MTICLTFDTDHMSERNMYNWLRETEIFGRATFYCGQHFDCLDKTLHTQAPHPDFAGAADFVDLIDRYQAMFPQARTWRSHSLLFSQSICVELFKRGYTSVSVSERFGDKNIVPNRLPWGPFDLSVYYMDNSDFCNFNGMHSVSHVPFSKKVIEDIFEDGSAIGGERVYVFDFHPIHVALNTVSYESYSRERDNYKGDGVVSLESETRYGVKNYYNDLISVMKKYSVESVSVESAVDQWRSRNAFR